MTFRNIARASILLRSLPAVGKPKFARQPEFARPPFCDTMDIHGYT